MEAYLPCGEHVYRYTEMTVFPLKSQVFIPEEEEKGTEGITETNVVITPDSLDIEINTGKALEILIESPETQKFTISVDGLPAENWANYPEEIDVKGRERAYVYIVPKEVGNYDFTVKVTAQSKTFQQDIQLYVSPASEAGEETNGLTGMISIVQGNWLIGLALISLLVLLVALYFVAGRFKKKTYEEYVYGPEPQQRPYNPRMMKGSAGEAISPPETANTARRGVDLGRLLPAEILKYTDGTYYPRYGSDFVNQ
jgi:hypothetical protein